MSTPQMSRATGPVTSQGKQRASQNALRHGYRAASPVLPGESAEECDERLDEYRKEFKPASASETRLVYTLADAEWRLDRALRDERHLVLDQIQQLIQTEEFATLDPAVLHAEATRRLIEDSTAYNTLQRYIAGFRAQYHRALKSLLDLRKRRDQRDRDDLRRLEAAIRAHPSPAPFPAEPLNPFNKLPNELPQSMLKPDRTAASLSHSSVSVRAATAAAPEAGDETDSATHQTPRSAPCPCGSGQKYKRCCGKNAPAVLHAAA